MLCVDDWEMVWGLYGLDRYARGIIRNAGDSGGGDSVCLCDDFLGHERPVTDSLRLYTLAFRHHLVPQARNAGSQYRHHLVERYARAGMFKMAMEYLQSIMKASDIPAARTWTSVMDSARRYRQPEFGAKTVSFMESAGMQPSKAILQALMHTYAENFMPGKALDILRVMKEKGMGVDSNSYATAIKACIRSADVATAEVIFSEMKEKGIKITHRLWNMLMMTYAAAADASGAETVWREMEKAGFEPNRRDYTALFRAYRESGQTQKALVLVKEVDKSEITPDISLITEKMRLFGILDMADEAIKAFQECRASGISPDRGAYNIIVDLLMDKWCDQGRPDHSGYLVQSSTLFNQGWQEGVFLGHGETGHRRGSRKGFMLHADLHRTGLWTCQFAIIKHLEDLYDTFQTEKRAVALKLISGKGRDYRASEKVLQSPSKMALVDVIRTFLGNTKIRYFEDQIGIFSIPKRTLHQLFLGWSDRGIECNPQTWKSLLVDPKIPQKLRQRHFQ